MVAHDLFGGLESVHDRHADVHRHDVRTEEPDLFDGFLAVGRRTDHLTLVVRCKDLLQDHGYGRRVFRYQDLDHRELQELLDRLQQIGLVETALDYIRIGAHFDTAPFILLRLQGGTQNERDIAEL